MITSRRAFLAGLAALPLAAGCAAPYGSQQSYLTPVIHPAKNNTVYHWVDVALQSVRDQAMPPPFAAYALAMPMAAGFLAANGIVKAYDTPFGIPSGPTYADPEAAYASAFAYAATETFQQPFVGDRKNFFAGLPATDAVEAGRRFGRDVARSLVKDRTYDNSDSFRIDNYLGRYKQRPDHDPLAWKPTGPFYSERPGPAFETFGRPLFPGLGQIRPWTMSTSSQFRAENFLDPRSPEFARQYHQTRSLGGENSIARTEDQRHIAIYWEDGPWGITPPGHFTLIAMQRFQEKPMSFIEIARAMALVGMTQCDSATSAWDSKYAHDIARPETIIRQRADLMGNPSVAGTGDKDWRSLIPTPNFPAYTSGHSTFGAAGAEMTALILGGDTRGFSGPAPDQVIWPELKGAVRHWTSLAHMAEENGWSRIYGGVHWEADHTAAMHAGTDIARQAFTKTFPRRV